MRKSLRKSGIDIIGDVPWGTHICQFYQTKEDLTDILVPYFKEGLENNEFCLWVTSQPLEVEAATEALRRSIPGIDTYLEKGQIEITSYNDWFLTEGAFDPEKVLNGCAEKLSYASHNGYEGVRLSGNNSWLDKENWERFIKYKEQTDNVICNCQIIALCTYSLDTHNIDEIIYLSVNHQFTLVKSNGKWKLIESSKRKLAEETAVRATKNWEHTFDAVPDLIAIIDTNYRVVRANSAMASKLGMTPEECIGLTCYRVVHGMTRPPSFCPHMQLLKDEFEHTAEVYEDCFGGFFIVSVSPLYDSEGKLIGSIHVARNINERRQMEEALRESEEKYRNLIETASEGIFLMNAEFKITYANEITAEMLGYTHEEIIGRPVMDFIPEESEPITEKNLENRLRDLNESYELKLMCKDGSPFWAFVSAKPLFNKDGDFTGSLCMFTDISERKQSEKALQESEIHFRTLAENSPDIITRFNRQYRHIYANPAAVESYGISLDEIIGKTNGELGRETKKVKSWEEYLESTFVTGKTKTIEYYISFQGKKNYFNTKIVPEFVGGKVISVLTISRDITDIKEAEAKLKVTLDNSEILVKERTEELQKAYDLLKESEKGLAEAQRMAHIGNLDWNLVNGEVHWSYELYLIFGRNPQESGATFDEFISYVHPDDRDRIYNAIKKALHREPVAGDYSIILANGEERKVHTYLEVIFDNKNTPLRIKGIVQDITENKKSEEKIRNLANIVESSSDAIGTISLESTITSWNKGAEQVYGYSVEEILGKPTSFVAPSHIGDETKKLSGRIKQGESIKDFETLRLRKDGKIIDVSITLSPVYDSRGRLTAISFISRDISERKKTEEKLQESEEKYRNIVETANECIYLMDDEAVVTYGNKRIMELSGYSQEEIIGRHIWDFISEESKPIVKLNLEKRLQGINESYEMKLMRKDGSSMWAFVSAKPFFNKDGELTGYLGMFTDITKRKEAEQALVDIEIARKKEIHHRIKNNLQVISSLLDLQAEKFKDRESIKYSEVLEAFKESQDRVISMALIHEELYKGGGLEKLDFSPYIEELTENLFHTYCLGNTDIGLKLNLENNVFFDMDVAVPLGMIINELVSNSFKHAFQDRKAGEIQIKLHREENGEYIKSIYENCKYTTFVLNISDNGIGIPESLKIEELDSLGLQLVTSLVDQLDGELELKRNNGTEFTIRFTVTEKNPASAPSSEQLLNNNLPKSH